MYAPQCQTSFESYEIELFHKGHGCLEGTAYKEVHGWDLASVSSMACDACNSEPLCIGWSTKDNLTASLFKHDEGEVNYKTFCLGLKKNPRSYPGSQ